MDAYTDFASVYDTFMDETPYKDWCAYLCSVLRRRGIVDGLILDLGCGTGTLTELLAQQGYDMIGVDSSQDMLNIAVRKKELTGSDILYLQQDMREFELYGTVRAAVSVCDSLNYLLDEEDLLAVFRLVNNYLDPKGLFIFDFNTVYKYESVIGNATIAENRPDCSFIWDNYYHEQEQVNEYDLTVFAKENPGSAYYRKFRETHYQRGYNRDTMERLIEKAGMKLVRSEDADTHGPVTEKSERIYVIAMEDGKKL